MYKLILILITSTFISTNSNSEVVTKINIKGNDRISSETIKIYGDLKLNQDYSESDLNNSLKKLYETDFFDDIQIEIINNNLNLLVKE